MKRRLLLLWLLMLTGNAVFAQELNVDSIVKVVTALNTGKKSRPVFNKDSLFNLLTNTTESKARIKLIYDLYGGSYADCKENVEMGYRILTWARANNDLISEAVISAELGQTMFSNGDRATATQLEIAAMAAAKKSKDNEALGIVYQQVSCRSDVKQSQIKDYSLTGLKFSEAANDMVHVSWGYLNLASYYSAAKPDSEKYFMVKAFNAAVQANALPEICQSLSVFGLLFKDDRRLRYIKTAYSLAESTSNAAAINFTGEILWAQYFEQDQLDSALKVASQTYRASRYLAIGLKDVPVYAIANIYFKKRNIDSTVKYFKLYYNLHEQLDNNKSQVWAQAVAFAEKEKQEQVNAQKTALKNSRQRWVLGLAIGFLLFLAGIFWRNYRLSHKANNLLARQKQQTEHALNDLKATQSQLVHAEKMASLGELTAGIAHEIQNPLNFVNNFSEVSIELLDELVAEASVGNIQDVVEIAAGLTQNLKKLHFHGKRAQSIVKGMLEHSRSSTGQREPANINKLADEYLRLSYHGLRAKDSSFKAAMATNFDTALPLVNVIPQDIGRVLLNLFNNAFYAVQQKQHTAGADYQPAINVNTTAANGGVKITIKDNGTGIPDNIKHKIMQPFFTTKPSGEGTGLGLSLSYDIVVKGHNGKLTVETEAGEGSVFCIELP